LHSGRFCFSRQNAEANDTVLVTTRADVTLLFPHIAPQILIQGTGIAQVRMR
jgi:hypothetical protein